MSRDESPDPQGLIESPGGHRCHSACDAAHGIHAQMLGAGPEAKLADLIGRFEAAGHEIVSIHKMEPTRPFVANPFPEGDPRHGHAYTQFWLIHFRQPVVKLDPSVWGVS